MASVPTVTQTVRWLDEAFRDYASREGWQPGDHRMFVRVNPSWGTTQVMLAAREFEGKDEREQWLRVMNFLHDRFDAQSPGLTQGVSLTIRTFDQIRDNEIFRQNAGFVDVEEFLGPRPAGATTMTPAP